MAEPIQLNFAYEDKPSFPFYMNEGDRIDWRKPGTSVELVKHLEDSLDILINFIRLPWKRCLSSLEYGDIDGLFDASFSPDRLKIGAYPMTDGRIDPARRTVNMAYVLYTLQGSNIVWLPEEKRIQGLTGNVGAPLGYSIVDDLRKLNIAVEETYGTDQDFNKLIRGRLGAVAALEMTGDLYLKKNSREFGGIVKILPPLAEKAYYLMLSHQIIRKHPQLAEQLWNTLVELRETLLEKISLKYVE